MSYVRFYSEADFNISIYNSSPTWDGDLWFSSDGGSTWNTWNQSLPTAWAWNNWAQETYEIWVRGENTTLTSRSSTVDPAPVFAIYRGSNVTPQNAPIYCEGNIESLFDYTKVDNNQHPTVTDYCCAFLFYQQTLLASAPDIGFSTVPANGCIGMFDYCSGLITPPSLPATVLNEGCYAYMFGSCTSLTTVPQLPAPFLANMCYLGMFSGSGIKISDTQHGAYNLPFIIAAEDNASYARYDMFAGCGITTPDVYTTYYILNRNQEYAITKSELSSIANAIRGKTGNNIPLTYPDDFISELNNIQPGEMTAFLSGSSLPANSLGVDGDFYTYTGS